MEYELVYGLPKGWLKHCDSYRLQPKYIAPVQADADRYYQEVIQRKAA